MSIVFNCALLNNHSCKGTTGYKDLKFKNLDFAGVTMLLIGLLLIIFGLTEGGVTWNPPKVNVTIPIGVALIVKMVLLEFVYLRNDKDKYQNKVVLSNAKSVEDDKLKKC